jgi:hypothetical protein
MIYLEVTNMMLSSFGAVPDTKVVRFASVQAGSAALTASADVFDASDVGKLAVVTGAGTNGAKMFTTIAAYISPTVVTLAQIASTSTVDLGVSVGTDCGPALQAALNAASAAHGGTIVIDGRYLLRTPVSLPFQNAAQDLRIIGTGGNSCLIVAGEVTADMINIDNVGRLLIEGVNFTGTHGEPDDCRRVLNLANSFVRIRGCGFFGLARIYGQEAAAIWAQVCELETSDNEFGGCVFSSGNDNAVVHSVNWVGFFSDRDRFIDYGFFNNLPYGKTGIAFSGAWIGLRSQKDDFANATTHSVARIRDSRFDEGCVSAISIIAGEGRRTSHVHIEGAQINNTLIDGGTGIFIARAVNVVIEQASIGFTPHPRNAITLTDCDEVLIDGVQADAGATGLFAAQVTSLTVKDSPGLSRLSLQEVTRFRRVDQGVGGVLPFTKYGRVTDADFAATPPVGTLAADLGNRKLYLRTPDGWVAGPAMAPSDDALYSLINATPATGTLISGDTYRKSGGNSGYGDCSANLPQVLTGSFRMRVKFNTAADETYVRVGASEAAPGPNVVSTGESIAKSILQNDANQIYYAEYGAYVGPYPYALGQECVLTFNAATGLTVLTIAGIEVMREIRAAYPDFQHRFTSALSSVGAEFQLLEYAAL